MRKQSIAFLLTISMLFASVDLTSVVAFAASNSESESIEEFAVESDDTREVVLEDITEDTALEGATKDDTAEEIIIDNTDVTKDEALSDSDFTADDIIVVEDTLEDVISASENTVTADASDADNNNGVAEITEISYGYGDDVIEVTDEDHDFTVERIDPNKPVSQMQDFTEIVGFDDASDFLVSGNHIKWIDRVNLKPYARNFYDMLVEATDFDGVDDIYIDDLYRSSNYVRYDRINYPEIWKETVESGKVTYTASPSVNQIMDNKWTVCKIKMEIKGATSNDILKKAVANHINKKVLPNLYMARSAFDRDYPEVFWLSGKLGYTSHAIQTIDKTNGIYMVYINCSIKPATIWNTSYSTLSENNIKDMHSKIETNVASISVSANNFDADNNGVAGEDVDKVTYYDYWLTHNNGYNTYVAAGKSSSAPASAWEIDSALMGTYGTKGPVCEAYSRAMMLLCERNGIDCFLCDGTAISSKSVSHMWNRVKVDGNWYGLDSTWDDAGSGANIISGGENTRYLLVGDETLNNHYKPFSYSHASINKSLYTGYSSYRFSNEPEITKKSYRFTYCGIGLSNDSVDYGYTAADAPFVTGSKGKFTYRWYKKVNGEYAEVTKDASYDSKLPSGYNAGDYYSRVGIKANQWNSLITDTQIFEFTDKVTVNKINLPAGTVTASMDKVEYIAKLGTDRRSVLVDLSPLVPENAGDITYKVSGVSGNSALITSANIDNNGVLSYIIGRGNDGDEVTIIAQISFQNYIEPVYYYLNVKLTGSDLIDIADATVKLSKTSIGYTGEQRCVKVTVKTKTTTESGKVKTVTLKENRDYVLEYDNNINVGYNATVTVRGIGKYTGYITKNFRITKKYIGSFKMILPFTPVYYQNDIASDIRRDLIVLNKNKVVSSNEYIVLINRSSTSTVSGSRVSSTRVRITVQAVKDGNYIGTTSKTLYTSIRPGSKAYVSMSESDYKDSGKEYPFMFEINKGTAYDWTGKAIKPKVNVYYGAEKLTKKYYSVSYINNIAPGIGTIIIKGKKDISGYHKINFKILPKTIKKLSIAKLPSITKEVKLSDLRPMVKDGSKVLTYGVDYTIKVPDQSVTELGGEAKKVIELQLVALPGSDYKTDESRTIKVTVTQ